MLEIEVVWAKGYTPTKSILRCMSWAILPNGWVEISYKTMSVYYSPEAIRSIAVPKGK